MKKILIIQLRRLGDVLLTTPVIDVLKDRLDVQIDFLVEKPFSDVLTDNPKLTNIFILQKNSKIAQWKLLKSIRKQKYDYVLDFFGNPRSAWWAFFSGAKQRFGYTYPGRKWLYTTRVKRDPKPKYVVDFKMDLLKPLGIESSYHKLSLFIADEIKQKMRSFLQDNGWDGTKKIVGLVVPNTRNLSMVKNWRMDGLKELAARIIREHNAMPLLLWGPGEYEIAKELSDMISEQNVIMCPDTTIKELAALISYCSAIVTGCVGPKHMAVALNVPTVTIYGPTQEICWNPPEKNNIAIKAKELDCIGCDKTICETMDCMKFVSVDMVFDAVKKFL